MKEIQILSILKSIIETQGYIDRDVWYNILNSLKNDISNKFISWEIERNNFGQALLLIDKFLFKNCKVQPYFFLSDLEKFVDEHRKTIDEIKEILKIKALQLVAEKDQFGNPKSYFQHWDRDRRIAVRIEKDLVGKIKEDGSVLLDLTMESKKATMGYYHRFYVTKYSEQDFNFGRQIDNNGHEESWEQDYFDAITDGQLGDFDDFMGNSNDVGDWSRG